MILDRKKQERFGGVAVRLLAGLGLISAVGLFLHSRSAGQNAVASPPAAKPNRAAGVIAKPAVEADPKDPSRVNAFQKAVEKGAAQSADWPKSAPELIEAFWKAASVKDYERMTVLCPGSSATDYKSYYDKWTPSAAKKVGPAESDPHAKGVTLYPVTLDFPGFPGKTVKMAVMTLPDGRIAVDGQHSIWW